MLSQDRQNADLDRSVLGENFNFCLSDVVKNVNFQFLSRRSCTKLQGPFTKAIFVAPKLHQVSNMFET